MYVLLRITFVVLCVLLQYCQDLSLRIKGMIMLFSVFLFPFYIAYRPCFVVYARSGVTFFFIDDRQFCQNKCVSESSYNLTTTYKQWFIGLSYGVISNIHGLFLNDFFNLHRHFTLPQRSICSECSYQMTSSVMKALNNSVHHLCRTNNFFSYMQQNVLRVYACTSVYL